MKTQWNTPDLTLIRQKLVDKLTLASEIVVSAAIEKCPVDTGNLRGSITAEIDENALVARVGTPVEYAPYIEFGTGEYAENGEGRKGGWFYEYDGNKGEKGKRFTRGSKPQPFLRPALLENKEKIAGLLNAS